MKGHQPRGHSATQMDARVRFARAKGKRNFQPRFISRSYRSRGKVVRSQMKQNMKNANLSVKKTGPMMPSSHGMPNHAPNIGHQPPRKSTMASAETLTMFTYSAMKNIDHLNPEYSVWKPAPSSPSASGRSNGVRFVSAMPATM